MGGWGVYGPRKCGGGAEGVVPAGTFEEPVEEQPLGEVNKEEPDAMFNGFESSDRP